MRFESAVSGSAVTFAAVPRNGRDKPLALGMQKIEHNQQNEIQKMYVVSTKIFSVIFKRVI